MDVSTAVSTTPGGISTLGQIGAGSFEGGTPSLAQQQISQAEQNISQGLIVQPSVSTQPNITPFPLGCPSGFYQSGDVCIPTVDTAGQNLPGAPAAGHDLPRGSIQQTVVDNTTTQGQPFYVTVYFTNNGILGKFFAHITISDIGVDVKTTGVWIPEGQNGVLYKQIVMPNDAPTTGTTGFSVAIQLQHQDPGTGNIITDDNDTAVVPIPGAGPVAPPTPTPTGPPFQTQCFMATDGSRWCSSPTDTGGCQADPSRAGIFWCKQCSCGSGQKWNNCVCGCVPSGSMMPDCPPGNCPQCPQPAPPTPPPAQACIQLGGQTYCQTNAPPGTAGCFTLNGLTYCAVGAGPPPPTCPSGYTYDQTNKVCVQNPQAPGTGMPDCFTITLPDLFNYASQYSRYVEIKTPNVLILSVQNRGLPPQTTQVRFCRTTTAGDDTVTINNIIYAPQWSGVSGGHIARVRRAAASLKAYPASAAGGQRAPQGRQVLPSCFTVTLPALFEEANRNVGQIHIRNANSLIARLQKEGLPLNNTSVSFCKTNEMSASDDCVEVQGQLYCAQLTHNENNLSPPAMVLSPSSIVKNGQTVTVNISSFAPNEQVTVTVTLTANPVGLQDTKNQGWKNKELENAHTGTTDETGSLRIQVPVPGLPTATKGHLLISVVGSRSLKQVAKDLVVS